MYVLDEMEDGGKIVPPAFQEWRLAELEKMKISLSVCIKGLSGLRNRGRPIIVRVGTNDGDSKSFQQINSS